MLLEREEQLAALSSRLDRAADRDGSIVLVAGEAGAGKTTLIREFVHSLGGRVVVISGACDPLTTPRPLGPLHDFATDPDSGLADLDFTDDDPFQIFEAVLDRLRSSIRPIVLIIEDIHWADDATLDFVRFLARRVGDTRAMVVCTYRDDEVGHEHPLRPVLGEMLRSPTTKRVGVPPLTLSAVGVLAEEHDVDPSTLFDLTDGNAFFVTEVLAAGYMIPASVHEAVMARVELLDGPARRVVEAVSIAPRSLTVDYAMALIDGDIDDVDAALAAGVLVGDALALRFRHELARSAVESSLPPARRLDLHRRMAALLEADDVPDHAWMAHHAVRAGDRERILRYGALAADEAHRRGSHRQAISFLEATIAETAKSEDIDKLVDLRLKLAVEYRVVDRAHDAVPILTTAVEDARESGDIASLGRALVEMCRTRWRLNDESMGMDALDAALALPFTESTRGVRAEAEYQLAYLHMLGRRGTKARRALQAARASAGPNPGGDLSWRLDMLDGTIDIVLGDARSGLEKLSSSVDSAERAGDLPNMAVALSMLGSGGGETREYEQAKIALHRSIEHGVHHDEDFSVAYSRSWLARIAHEQGEWDAAVRYAELVATTTPHRQGIAYMTAMSALGRVRVRRGDPGGLSLLDEQVAAEGHHELQHIWNAICGRAEHFWLRGDSTQGREELESAYVKALETESEWARGEIGYWMWKNGAIDSPPPGAAEPFRLQMEGNWERAAQAWSAIGCPYEVALSLYESKEEEACLEALDTFQSLGAKPMIDRLRSELRAMGVESVPRGPARSTRSNPWNLTNRQLEVVELISEGLSNSEIAERLFITKKTVEHHVSAILTKLGVGNRAEVISVARAEK